MADALHSAAIRLLRGLRKEDAVAGVTGAQLSVLSVLVFAGRQSVSALARAEQVSLPTMSRLLTEMERRGLVARTSESPDRRTAWVDVTEAGRALLLEGREKRLAKLVGWLEGLTAPERDLLHRSAKLMLRLGERDET